MKKRTVIAMLLASAMMLTACDTLMTVNHDSEATEETDQTNITAVTTAPVEVTEPSETTATPAVETTTLVTEESAQESSDETRESGETELGEELTADQMLEFFRANADEYMMSSGAGGWAAYLNVTNSGSFTYNYHDFDAGAYYICHAQGQFSNMTKIDDNIYTVEVIYMNYEYNEGDEWTEVDTDGIEINYVAADSYGIHEGDILYFYVEGSATADLPEGYVTWYAMPRALPLENVPDPFPLAGFYNPVDDCAYIEDDYE